MCSVLSDTGVCLLDGVGVTEDHDEACNVPIHVSLVVLLVRFLDVAVLEVWPGLESDGFVLSHVEVVLSPQAALAGTHDVHCSSLVAGGASLTGGGAGCHPRRRKSH